MSGLKLDESFDFAVGPSGDIATTDSDVADIEKDLAVITAAVLTDRAQGIVLEGTGQRQLETLVAGALRRHGRVDSVVDVSIQTTASGDFRSTITVVVDGTEIQTTV